MPKNNSLQRYKHTLQKQINFSFSQPKTSVLHLNQPLQTLIPSEKRSLGMWINTVLQLQSQQFLHALKHCRKYSIGQLNQYMIRNYGHLKAMIRYYVIAALLDYEQIPQKNQQSIHTSRECVFLNIVIEELTNRFFRQSQWLHKISHQPPFLLYSIFDPYLRGYTTLREITKITEKELLAMKQQSNNLPISKKLKKLKNLLAQKWTNNLEGKDPRIYQQNFEQLMLRVNVVSFEEIFATGKTYGGSQRFHLIDKAIKDFREQQTERQLVQEISEVDRSRKGQEELEIMTEDYQIKQKSEMMSRKDFSTDVCPQTQRKDYKSIYLEDAFASTPEPLSQKKIPKNLQTQTYGKFPWTQSKNRSYINRPQSIPQTQFYRSYNQQNTAIYEKQLSNELIFQNIKQIERNRNKLALRSQIIRELEVIKEEKRKTHLQYLKYV